MSDRETPAPLLVLAAGWLVPGAGTWLLGERGRAAAQLVFLVGTFLVGLLVTSGHAVSLREHPIIFAVEAPAGLIAIAPAVIEYARGAAAPAGRLPDAVVAALDLGFLFCMTAGLLNLLVAVDAWERAIRRRAAA